MELCQKLKKAVCCRAGERTGEKGVFFCRVKTGQAGHQLTKERFVVVSEGFRVSSELSDTALQMPQMRKDCNNLNRYLGGKTKSSELIFTRTKHRNEMFDDTDEKCCVFGFKQVFLQQKKLAAGKTIIHGQQLQT